jgi:hypothetical protein
LLWFYKVNIKSIWTVVVRRRFNVCAHHVYRIARPNALHVWTYNVRLHVTLNGRSSKRIWGNSTLEVSERFGKIQINGRVDPCMRA